MVRESGLSFLEQTDVMGPLKDPFALFLFSTGIEKRFHRRTPEEFPRVSTRDHISIRRVRLTPLTPEGAVGSLLGVPKDIFLKGEHDGTDYDTEGEIPGIGDDSPEEVLVFVHGWLSDEKAALGRMSVVRHNLRENGYGYPVVGFTWDTEQTVAEWESGKVIADWNGPKLAQFTADYARQNPDTRIRYLSNSLGATPVFSALEALEGSGLEDVVESATIMCGTVPSRSVSVGGRYGDAIREAVGDVYNYWTPEDRTLRQLYRLVEKNDCVGGTGAKGKTPQGYHENAVGYVPDHFSFLVPERGCMDEVVGDLGPDTSVSLSDAEIREQTAPEPRSKGP